MVSVYKEVEVEIDMYDIDTADLIEELERRKIPVTDKDIPVYTQLNDLYFAYSVGQQDRVDALLKELFYDTIGRIA